MDGLPPGSSFSSYGSALAPLPQDNDEGHPERCVKRLASFPCWLTSRIICVFAPAQVLCGNLVLYVGVTASTVAGRDTPKGAAQTKKSCRISNSTSHTAEVCEACCARQRNDTTRRYVSMICVLLKPFKDDMLPNKLAYLLGRMSTGLASSSCCNSRLRSISTATEASAVAVYVQGLHFALHTV